MRSAWSGGGGSVGKFSAAKLDSGASMVPTIRQIVASIGFRIVYIDVSFISEIGTLSPLNTVLAPAGAICHLPSVFIVTINNIVISIVQVLLV